MKRTKVLAMTLALATMVMGAGYAYWTDTLTINNTVSTGELRVEFVDDAKYPNIFGHTGEQYIEKSAVQTDVKTTTIEIGNMYPGGYVRYELKMQNLGTIPVIFDNAVVNFTEDLAGLKNVMNGQFGHYVKNEDGSGTNVGGITGFFKLKDLEKKLNERLAGVRLEPGQYLTFDIPEWLYEEMQEIDPNWNPEDPHCISFVLPTTVVNEDNVEDATLKMDMTINWKQHNAN